VTHVRFEQTGAIDVTRIGSPHGRLPAAEQCGIALALETVRAWPVRFSG
jgi:hypothetical protein